MFHTNKYDRHTPRHAVPGPLTSGFGTADTTVPNGLTATGTVGGWAALILGVVFIAMAGVGGAGAYSTYHNMSAALGDSDMAIGLVAAGEGVVAVLGLTLICLTLIARPYPLPFRLGLWIMPVVGSAVGIYLAKDDSTHRVVYAVTPLAMTAAAELAGYVARSIIVHRTGRDAEADRRTGELLRRIEFHRARAQHHPDEKVRAKSATEAWKLAERLGRGDPRLTTALTEGYAERTTASALAALDTLYGRSTTVSIEARPVDAPVPVPIEAPVPAELASPDPVFEAPSPVFAVETPVEPPAMIAEVETEVIAELVPVSDEIPGQLLFDTTGTDTGTAADTTGTVDAEAELPIPGARLSDVELDAVVHMIRMETEPPRSYREMEARFREMGYQAGADRLRAAWNRVAVTYPVPLEG
ncbi:hypothetical protein ACFV4P_35450 [Kitasatospora sp. NPDC059795]|uniref:hypothetical protein n=1 Tax=Kitasatospora sp. NPDC059795 TaxID=3346949 RepID=UPI0036676D57